MDSNDLTRLHARLDDLYKLHQENVRDLSVHGLRIDTLRDKLAALELVSKEQIGSMRDCCEENRKSITAIQMTESNMKSALALLKWILGLLWAVVGLASMLMWGVKFP